MSATLAGIWRHPVKSLGREAMERVDLTVGAWLPCDRLWAVAHDKARIDAGQWAKCANFLRCTHGAGLMAVTARLDGDQVTLDHPDAGQHVLEPDGADAFDSLRDWLTRIWPADLPAPTGIYRYADGSLTDNPNPWLTIHTTASHRAVEERAGRDLSMHRWRGNLWLDGFAPWEEFGWIGQEIRVGSAVLRVEERVGRCKATHANPETGERDIDMLGLLRAWGHQDFGVFARVIEGGEIMVGDRAVVLG